MRLRFLRLFFLALSLLVISGNVDARVEGLAKGAGNVWDDIVVQGNKGIREALSTQYKTIDEFLNSSEYASKVASDFTKYQARGGSLDLAKYTNKHRTLTSNRMQGNIAETVFKDLEGGMKAEKGINTFDGPRYVDNILNGTAREVKSGLVNNTTDIQRQILKDIDIIVNARSSDITKIEWHCLNGVDDAVLQFTKTELTKAGLSGDVFKFVKY